MLGLAAEKATDPQDEMSARIVSFLMVNRHLHEARSSLGDTPVLHVMNEVVSCNAHDDVNARIHALGLHYRERLLRALRQSKDPLPASYVDVSRPCLDTMQDMINDCLGEHPKDSHSAGKAPLARDSFRCMLTGVYEIYSRMISPQIRSRERAPIECCPILSGSANDPRHPTEWQKRVFAVLKSFGLESIVSTLTAAGGIHDLSNLLSLRSELHTAFDDLEIWLEPTSQVSNDIPVYFLF
ncbi:unnamed protein product [Cyclocybe aegerita]|uniref:HNH nuclease domain-containing protein n=1 Tax=Cyclocybe aegerita TaxID=1973307 RepID=A0A8S0VXB1_CYCAE|nr:unnamed protein product [Cyclocybe aegerita]